MKQFYFSLLALFLAGQINAQIGIVEGFEGGVIPTGWTQTGGYYTTTANTCSGAGSIVDNLYGSSATGTLVSPSATSNGTDVAVSFQWKTTEYSTGSGIGLTADVQYSIDGGATYTNFGTPIASSAITSCSTWSATIPAASVPSGSNFKFKIATTRTSGDFYFFVDVVSLTQTVTTPPLAVTLSTPANGATGASVAGILIWPAANGIPTGYNLRMGTTSGGTDVVNDLDVGNVTTYDIPGVLMGNTTYYVKVTP